MSLEHFSSKPWLCYNSTWWICINEFASNLIRSAIQLPATPLLRTFGLWPSERYLVMRKACMQNWGTAMPMTIICVFFLCLFVSVCILGTHYLSDILSSGGSKQLYLLNPSVHTHLYTTHCLHQRTWTWSLMAEKAMIIKKKTVLCAYSIGRKFW